MVSRKLDGVRTIALLNQGEVELYSRTGQMFTTLDNLKPQIKEILAAAKKLYGEEYVLDGETCLVDENGKEDFAGIMKQITRKKHTIPNPTYILFDIIKRSEFDETIGTEKFGERIKKLVTIKPETFGSFVRIVEHETDLNENTISE
jgi:ATP-dependent DNA ligase